MTRIGLLRTMLRGAPEDPAGEADRLFTAAAEAAAPELTALAERLGRDWINERDHLQPTYRGALESAAAAAWPRPQVSPSLGSGLERCWPRSGKFDVSLRWPNATTVFGELKCGSDEGTLGACAWDAPKCAMAVRCGTAAAAHLIAAAPATLWKRRALGVELLADAEWEMADVRARYASHFTKFEKDGYKPVRVPERLRTVAVGATGFTVADRPWRLGVARVEPVGEGWLDWVPFLG